MLRNCWILSALALAITTSLALACAPAGDDDDTVPDPDAPVVTDLSPGPGDIDFFYQAPLWAEWNVAPEGAGYALAMGTESISGTTDTRSSGRVLSFTPDAALLPSASYTSTISWNSPDSPLTFEFQTGAYGNVVDDESNLIGRTFNLDLASADFVEPPGVGPILQSSIGDTAILFSPTGFVDSSNTAMHILGAVGEVISGEVSQDPCAQTLGFTAGPDGDTGTADDVPATWNNPVMEMGPTDLVLNFQGIAATIQDLNITGTFHPSLSDMRGGTFSGRIDTRPLAPELDPEGGEDAICTLVSKTVGVECQECGEPNPGVFCLSIVAENVNAGHVPLVLEEISCTTVIDRIATCAEAAAAFDEDGDGTYELCPDASGDDDDSAAGDDDDSAAGDDDDSATGG